METSCDLLLYVSLVCGLFAVLAALAVRTVPKLTGSANFIYLKETIESELISTNVESYNYSIVNHANSLIDNNDSLSGKRLKAAAIVTLLYSLEVLLLVLWLFW